MTTTYRGKVCSQGSYACMLKRETWYSVALGSASPELAHKKPSPLPQGVTRGELLSPAFGV